MPHEIGFVDRHVFNRDQFIVADKFHHAVNQDKWVAMRNRVENPTDIERGLRGLHRHRLSLLFRLTLFAILQFLEECFRQFGIDRVTGSRRHDMRLQRHPEQHHVAPDIENLMPHEFILKSQRLLRENLVAFDDHRAIERTALDLTEFQQFFDIFVDRKRAGGGDLRDIGIRINRQRKMLGMNPTIVGRRAGNFQFVTR